MKVMHVINGEYYAGAERVQEHIFRAIEGDERFQLDVVLYKDGVFKEKSGLSGFVNFKRLGGFNLVKFKRIVERIQPDVIHCHSPMTLVLAKTVLFVCFGRKSPRFVYHVHSPVLEDTESKGKNLIKYALERIALHRTRDQVICVSKSVLLRSPHLKPVKYIDVLENGVPVARKENKNGRMKADYVVLSFAGLIRPRKGFDVLVKAISRLPNEVRSLMKVSVYGEFESDAYKVQILNSIEELVVGDVFEFHGFVKDVPKAISETDAFIIPSLYGEGLPMVLLEAMSVGATIIASDVGGISDVLTSGQNGFLFTAGDADDLARLICHVSASEEVRFRVGAEAKYLQVEEYSIESMTNGLIDIYQRL